MLRSSDADGGIWLIRLAADQQDSDSAPIGVKEKIGGFQDVP